MEEETAARWVERFVKPHGDFQGAYRHAKAWVDTLRKRDDCTPEGLAKWQHRVNVIKTRALLEGIQLE